ncbi:MAG: nucleotidyltransferase family protein [Pseudomonadota bacterium]
MQPSKIVEQHRHLIRDTTARFGFSNPRVLGSALRATGDAGSDLDLLVDPPPGATLFNLGGLQEELQSLIGLRVDLLTPADLPLTVRTKVLAEAQPL